MARPNAIKEAKLYAKTVATFMVTKPLEELLEDAVLAGFKLCKEKYGLTDDIFERQMADKSPLFEWSVDPASQGALGIEAEGKLPGN